MSASVAILDSDTSGKLLGIAFRRNRPGPELELVRWFLKERRFDIPRGCAATIFCEPYIESGCPDVVVVLWNTATAKHWNPQRRNLTHCDLRVLQYLYRAGPTCSVELEKTHGARVKATIERLLRARTIRRLHGRWQTRALSSIFAVKRIIAVEAKISKWEEALHQAFLNTWFASDSYILLPRMPRSARLLKQARTFGVHVATKERSHILLPHGKAAGIPRSYQSWLFNEWAWRAGIKPRGKR